MQNGSEWEQEAFDGFAFQSEFPPFVDESAGLDHTATGGNSQVAVVPPDSTDGDDSVKTSPIPETERSAKCGRAVESFAPVQQEFEGLIRAGQGTQGWSGVQFFQQDIG